MLLIPVSWNENRPVWAAETPTGLGLLSAHTQPLIHDKGWMGKVVCLQTFQTCSGWRPRRTCMWATSSLSDGLDFEAPGQGHVSVGEGWGDRFGYSPLLVTPSHI